jgi:hypothetical protein
MLFLEGTKIIEAINKKTLRIFPRISDNKGLFLNVSNWKGWKLTLSHPFCLKTVLFDGILMRLNNSYFNTSRERLNLKKIVRYYYSALLLYFYLIKWAEQSIKMWKLLRSSFVLKNH